MNTLLVLSCLIGASVASYAHEGSAYVYHGRYPGKCSYDGLYYRDEKSFVFCSNGNSYEQNCAPGSRNSGYGKFAYGQVYSHRDFCDVNLVDTGYAAEHAPKYEEPKYEEPKYEEPKYEHEEPSYHEPAPKYEEEPSYDAYTYHGKWAGKCENDGLYYKDEYSFVYCSNGNHYDQPCAPGSKNSAYGEYSYGGKYNYRDFCDINLVDGGYASHDGYGYEYVKPSYKAENTYDEPSYEPAPKYEAPVYEPAPKYEAPVYEPAPKHEAPVYEPAPKYEAPVYEPAPKYEPEHKPHKEPVYTYHGKYGGKCQYDGLYYKDAESFVFCVNGNSYVQPCAPGSRNSAYAKFSYGSTYSERDFCDVNLVDEGYAAKKAVHYH